MDLDASPIKEAIRFMQDDGGMMQHLQHPFFRENFVRHVYQHDARVDGHGLADIFLSAVQQVCLGCCGTNPLFQGIHFGMANGIDKQNVRIGIQNLVVATNAGEYIHPGVAA